MNNSSVYLLIIIKLVEFTLDVFDNTGSSVKNVAVNKNRTTVVIDSIFINRLLLKTEKPNFLFIKVINVPKLIKAVIKIQNLPTGVPRGITPLF